MNNSLLKLVVHNNMRPTVEFDKSCLTKRKCNRGRLVLKKNQWVLEGICRGKKECFTVPVLNRLAHTLLPINIENVVPGTTILTDEWRSYLKLGKSVCKMLIISIMTLLSLQYQLQASGGE